MNGKGDSPRSCFSRQFKKNYDSIEWKKVFRTIDEVCGQPDGSFENSIKKQTEEYELQNKRRRDRINKIKKFK